MNANELMLWDWVYVPHRGKASHYGKVTALLSSGAVETEINGSLALSSSVEPIPLAPEILEKNGFVKNDENDLSITCHLLIPTGYEAHSYTIQITFYKEPICGVGVLFKVWGWIPPYNGGINDIHLCSVKYVHEVQHALRLCGIEKKIIL